MGKWEDNAGNNDQKSFNCVSTLEVCEAAAYTAGSKGKWYKAEKREMKHPDCKNSKTCCNKGEHISNRVKCPHEHHTCKEWCKRGGLKCTGAWDPAGKWAEKGDHYDSETMGCSHGNKIGCEDETMHDAICRCEEPKK